MKYLLVALYGLFGLLVPLAAQADDTGSYPAAIWVDPEGCEHWVLDLGVEGMMSPHLDRNGSPVCGRPTNICMSFSGDLLFDVDKSVVKPEMIEPLKSYFSREIAKGTFGFIVQGHTDSTGGTLYNFDLGRSRANAVADVARLVGAMIQTETYGEMQPIASNNSEAGRRRNRRVEVICE